MTSTSPAIPEKLRSDVATLWDYHDMHHELRPADAGIGLGSHDPSVAKVAVNLYRQGMFPVIVFTGGDSPTTVDRFPRGEAVHYLEYATEHGVPTELILTETAATNTGQNITSRIEPCPIIAMKIRSAAESPLDLLITQRGLALSQSAYYDRPNTTHLRAVRYGIRRHHLEQRADVLFAFLPRRPDVRQPLGRGRSR